MAQSSIYGLMAEFDSPEALVAAARSAFAEGFRKMDGYSPFPVDGLAEALGFHRTRVPLIVLIGGIIGCLGGFFLQYWAVGHRLSDQRRRQTPQQLASVCSSNFRTNHSHRRLVCIPGGLGTKRSADALPSGVQRRSFRAGQPQQIFSLHRVR